MVSDDNIITLGSGGPRVIVYLSCHLGKSGLAARTLVLKGQCSEVLSVITQQQITKKEAFHKGNKMSPSLRGFWKWNLKSKQKLAEIK